MNRYIIAILSFISGSVALCLYAAIQMSITDCPIALQAYFAPLILGGGTGLFLGIIYFTLKQGKTVLQKEHDDLGSTIEVYKDELDKKDEIITKITITDRITGFYNHKFMVDMLSKKAAEAIRYKHGLAIILMAIDYFQQINDTYGNQLGDEIIVRIGSQIKADIREVDIVGRYIVGRYGRDEFLIILPHCDLNGCNCVGERFRENIEKLLFNEEGLKVTVSGGIGTLNNNDFSAMLMHADEHLHNAIEKGGNQIESYAF